MRVSYREMHRVLCDVLRKYGFDNDRAQLCARLFTETSLDGIASHGLNRFPTFIRGIQRGYIKPDMQPEMKHSYGVIERWDGRLGAGNLNAWYCMKRAIEKAADHGIGLVALSNTNHWLRGGTYGWQAADAGFIAICWTNTKPNLPPWGARQPAIGNNPLVIAVPRHEGHIVLDMALSLYSYGKLESFRLKGEELTFHGGYNEQNELTQNPAEIEKTERILPVGFWKGSGLSLVLDVMASALSHGDAVWQIGEREHEYGLSQIFIAVDIKRNQALNYDQIVNEIISFTKGAQTAVSDEKIYFPGEQTLLRRKENLRNGIPVDEIYWQQVLDLGNGR